MSEDNEYDNEWGTKKQKYYSMNKRENNSAESDSDFIEDEKEAIRLQKLRAQKIKKYQTLKEEEELSENEDKNVGMKNKEKKEEDVIGKDIKFNKVEVDDNKIFENIEGLIILFLLSLLKGLSILISLSLLKGLSILLLFSL